MMTKKVTGISFVYMLSRNDRYQNKELIDWTYYSHKPTYKFISSIQY